MDETNDKQIIDEAIAQAKLHKKELIEEFCDIRIYPPSENPYSLFMAGPPGVGKTEYSKGIIKAILDKDKNQKIIRLDVDEFRKKITTYNGKNSSLIQPACTILFDKAYDLIQGRGQDVIVDGTFSSEKSIDNIQRALNRKRKVSIIYLYQDPTISWMYAKKREKLDGRHVPKDFFIRSFLKSIENADLVKKTFGKEVMLDLIQKDKDNNFERKAKFNVSNVSDNVEIKYSEEWLEKNLEIDIL